MSIEDSRHLSRLRIYRLNYLKNALKDEGQEIQRKIIMSQGSSGVSLSQDSMNSNVANSISVGHEGLKRRFEFSSEDEGMSLSKYRKLTTEEKIIKAKEENDTDTSSLSDDLSDVSSDVEDKNEENEMLTVENDAVENDIVENSYSPDELCCIPLPNGQVQIQCDTKIIEANSESDVDSFGISPQKELSSSQISDKIDIKPDELENYILASNIAKAHDHIIHTSQFSTSNDLDVSNVNNITEERTEIVNKLNSNEETTEIVNEFHSAENVVEETVIIEEHNMSEERIDKNNITGNGVVPGDCEQEDAIQNLLNNAQFAIGDAPSCENATDFQLKKSDSMAMEIEQVNEVIIPAENVHPNNAGQENSSLMQPSEHLYHIPNNVEQAHSSHMHSEHLYEVSNAQQGHSSCTHPSEHLYHVSHDAQQAHSSHMHPSEHFYQATNTNDARGGQSNNELCQQNSVSDLNLAQLVLSLKEDIQQLTKKIERQENILDAVVHANEINLTPLFAQSFPEKYSLKLPFTRIEDFDEFNQDLARNTSFCNEFITSLCSYIDNNVTLSRNILLMLRKYMSKDLTMLYTASKSTGDKMVLKDTLFCKCMLQATKLTIRNGALPLEHEKAFMKNLGLVVSRVKGWPTHAEEKINNGQG